MPFALSGVDRKKSGVFRSLQGGDPTKQKIMNVFKNVAAPFSTGSMLKGSVAYVALEVAVAKVLRKILKVDNKTYTELACVHAMTLPLLGGMSAMFANKDSLFTPYGTKKIAAHIKEGAKSLPALFTAQYVYDSYCHGIGLRFWTAKEALIMAVAKIMTRPIAAKLYGSAKIAQNAFDSVALLHTAQGYQSNLARKVAIKSRYDDP